MKYILKPIVIWYFKKYVMCRLCFKIPNKCKECHVKVNNLRDVLDIIEQR